MVSLTSLCPHRPVSPSPPWPQPLLTCHHPKHPATWETTLIFSLRFFTFPRSFTHPLGMRIAFLPQQEQYEMRRVWTWGTFTLPSVVFLVWHQFLPGPPSRKKKMLKFTKLFLIALVVNIDIVSTFYSDSSKVGFNFILMRGRWLPTNSILAEAWAQLLINTKALSRDNCLISWNFESLRFNLQAHLVCIMACFISLFFFFSLVQLFKHRIQRDQYSGKDYLL